MPFLGLDIGTSATKALLLSDHGKIIATAESPHTLQSPQPGWSEQNPAEWWRAVQKATRQLLAKSHTKPHQIKAIALSGQMHGSVFLNASGKPLRPAILWNDQRTAKQCAQIETLAGGRAKLIAMVANPALTGFTAPKILWLQQNEPSTYQKTKMILLPKDFIRYQLTGEFATEVSDASGTLLLNVSKRAWHTDFIRKLHIDPALLPPVFESQQITGALTPHAAKLLGLSPGTPVAGGGGDQAMGAVGSGVVSAGLLGCSLGTSGVLFGASDTPQLDTFGGKNNHGRVHTMCHAIPHTWCVFGCMLSAGGSLQYLRNLLYANDLKNLKDPGSLYPHMIKLAQSAPPGAENLFYLPYLTGERCPHPDPNATAAFIGLTPRHTMPYILRATLEGITFGLREQVQILRQMKIPIHQIRATSGGARSKFWRQLQADMFNAPVATINVSQGAALGAAIIAAVAAKAYNSVPEACSALIRVNSIAKPNPASARFYARHYQKYASLYPTLKSTFPLLKAL